MTYYTGSISTPALLKTTIETLCVTNGWSLASDWLSKGDCHTKLTAPDGNFLNINGANSADGLTELATFTRSLYIKNAQWPVTYHLGIYDNPNFVICVLDYDAGHVQVLMFGEIVKVHPDAYVGGNFFYATNCTTSNHVLETYTAADTGIVLGNNTFTVNNLKTVSTWGGSSSWHSSIIPFAHLQGNYNYEMGFHAKIDGNVWDTARLVSYTDSTLTALKRSPNLWNSQAHLVPMQLQFAMKDSLYGYLGYLDHIRLIRMDNYQSGDIVTITPDRWKVFPWRYKDMVNRNGGSSTSFSSASNSGTLGFAIQYDGI